MPTSRITHPEQQRLGWVRSLSARIVVLAIVVLVAFALVVPTMMRYLDQRAETRELQQSLAQTTATNEELSSEIDRWGDDNYVIAQARERLSYGFEGETSYQVIDPQTVVDTANPKTGQEVTAGAVEFPIGAEKTWYGNLWDSVEVAGNAK